MGSYTYSFEKLEVWVLSKDLYKSIYYLTKSFPEDERFGLTSQIRRSSLSISLNLAEGSSRKSKKEKIRFIELAFGSLLETLNILIIVSEIELIENDSYSNFRSRIEEIGNKLNALKKAFQ